ncbi:hypothetical protein FRC11_002842 [Ceratobasidium sp. 423]|nr:hypothetical protein FRC11_002842 [Ceratobasidium sp. 423]
MVGLFIVLSYNGHSLTGPAALWYNVEVEGSATGLCGWTTLSMFQGLQSRFITQKSAAEAGRRFWAARQGDKKVMDFWHELITLAGQCPTVPDPYTFNERFLRGLDSEIADKVLKLGYSVEEMDSETLGQVALDMENTLEAMAEQQETMAASDTENSKSISEHTYEDDPSDVS